MATMQLTSGVSVCVYMCALIMSLLVETYLNPPSLPPSLSPFLSFSLSSFRPPSSLTACECDAMGSEVTECHMTTGECTCKSHVTGSTCNTCEVHVYIIHNHV